MKHVILEKADWKRGDTFKQGKVQKKVMVTRGGKTFPQIMWVWPESIHQQGYVSKEAEVTPEQQLHNKWAAVREKELKELDVIREKEAKELTLKPKIVEVVSPSPPPPSKISYEEGQLLRFTKERERAWKEYNDVKDDSKVSDIRKRDLGRIAQRANMTFYDWEEKVEAKKKEIERDRILPKEIGSKIINVISSLIRERQNPDIDGTSDHFNLTFQADRGGSDGLFRPRRGEEDDDWPEFVGRKKVIDRIQSIVGPGYKVDAWDHEKGLFSVGIEKIKRNL